MLLNIKIKIRLLGLLSPPNDNKFVTFYQDCPIKAYKGARKRTLSTLVFDFQFIYNPGGWLGLYNSGRVRLYNPVVGLYNPMWGLYNAWSVCGDGGANLVYLSLAY